MMWRSRSSKFRGIKIFQLGALLLMLATGWDALAQQSQNPAITFTYDFPGSQPDHYFISVSAQGQSSYDSTAKLTPSSGEDDPYRLDFKLSQENCSRIFALAQRANYFKGKIDSGQKKIANTGAKTLTYDDGVKSTRATYNYSPLAPVQELTKLFAGISSTLEFERRLTYEYRYQKLALDDELKQMEDLNDRDDLEELVAVVPILQKIAMDTSLVNIARARAQRLLLAAQKADSSSQR